MQEFRVVVRILGPFPNMDSKEEKIQKFVKLQVLSALYALAVVRNGRVEVSITSK